MTHPGVLFMRALALLPLPAVRGVGAALGQLLYWLLRSRRRVALTNLRLCFPELDEAARRPRVRKATKPTQASKRRRLQDKKRRSTLKAQRTRVGDW